MSDRKRRWTFASSRNFFELELFFASCINFLDPSMNSSSLILPSLFLSNILDSVDRAKSLSTLTLPDSSCFTSSCSSVTVIEWLLSLSVLANNLQNEVILTCLLNLASNGPKCYYFKWIIVLTLKFSFVHATHYKGVEKSYYLLIALMSGWPPLKSFPLACLWICCTNSCTRFWCLIYCKLFCWINGFHIYTFRNTNMVLLLPIGCLFCFFYHFLQKCNIKSRWIKISLITWYAKYDSKNVTDTIRATRMVMRFPTDELMMSPNSIIVNGASERNMIPAI